jgi:hypothetical protein
MGQSDGSALPWALWSLRASTCCAGKLKDLGNTILGKFGMSTNDFECVKDPNTGSFSIGMKKK